MTDRVAPGGGGSEVRTVHPGRVDVELHTADDTGVGEHVTEAADRQCRSGDVDLVAVGGDPEAGAVDEGSLADRVAPIPFATADTDGVGLTAGDQGWRFCRTLNTAGVICTVWFQVPTSACPSR